MIDIDKVAMAMFTTEAGGVGWPEGMPEKYREMWRNRASSFMSNLKEIGLVVVPEIPTDKMLQAGLMEIWLAMVDESQRG